VRKALAHRPRCSSCSKSATRWPTASCDTNTASPKKKIYLFFFKKKKYDLFIDSFSDVNLSDSEEDGGLQLRDELRPIRHLASFLANADGADADPNAPAPGDTDSSAIANSAANVPASAYPSVTSIAALATHHHHHHHHGAASSAAANGAGGDDDGGAADDDLSDKVDHGKHHAALSSVAATSAATTTASGAKKRKRKSDAPHEPILCSYVDGRPCKSRAQIGSKFCYHHQPMDPNSDYVTCEFQGKKKCSLPVRKDAPPPRLCKRHMPVDPVVDAANKAAIALAAANAAAAAAAAANAANQQ
jgi:hypothetical protein